MLHDCLTSNLKVHSDDFGIARDALKDMDGYKLNLKLLQEDLKGMQST